MHVNIENNTDVAFIFTLLLIKVGAISSNLRLNYSLKRAMQ